MIAVKWMESTQDVKQECWQDKIFRPKQDVSHKKECICHDPLAECHPPTDSIKNLKSSETLPKSLFNSVGELARLG